jgi:tetratricopeptide (TPR) repeat protein
MIFKKYILRIFLCFTTMVFLFCDTIPQENTTYQLYFDKAEKDFEKQNHTQAFYNYEKAKASCNIDLEKEKIIYCLSQMSTIQLRQSDYAGSESSATEALSFFSDNTNLAYKIFIYNMLGLDYLEQNNYEESLLNYKKSLSITKTEISKLIIQNNIAYNYLKQGKFHAAKNILEPIKNKDSLKKNPYELARVLDNLGYAKFKIKDKTAINDLLHAKQIREEKEDNIGLTATSMHLAEFYEKSNVVLAKEHALSAFKYASKVKNSDDKLEALQYLARVSNGEDSKKYAIQSFLLNDSIKTVKQQAKNQFAKIKYDSKKAIEESQKQKQLKEYFIIGILFLLVFSLFFYYRIKKKNKKRIKETVYHTETRISKKLHDELANDVHNAIAFAETQDLENPINKETLLGNLDTIYIRARNISSENKDIDTGENYLEKLKAMIASYNSNSTNVILNTASFDDKNISKEIKITIYRVLQELMVNMKKHSHCSIVSIGFKSNKKAIEINYSDNGIGSANLLNLKNGLQNVENRIFSINGTINFDTASDKGFKVKIGIPK